MVILGRSRINLCEVIKSRQYGGFLFFISFYFYIYSLDSHKSDEGANTEGKQLPRPAMGDAEIR